MRVIDSHVHFWDPGVLHYPWHAELPAMQRRFLPADLGSLADGSVAGVVFVEANCLPEEAASEIAFVEHLARNEARLLGAVASVDFTSAETRLRSLALLDGGELVVGARQNIQGNPAGFALQDEYVRGVQDVGARNLGFDLCISADQMPEAIALVASCPETRFILDHCGKPAIRNDAFAPWADDLARLANFGNVHCKLSGLLTEARPDQCHAAGIAPYARHAMSCFGPDRLIYGSDWPVVTAAGIEPQWRALAETFTSSWTRAERQAFFHDNAVRFYGLRLNAQS